jgi:1-acyl-sn-glycerol-3-phosphate acyltransferase
VKERIKSLSYYIAKLLVGAFVYPYFRPQVIGRHNLPRKGAFLLAANHMSYWDPMILGVVLSRRIWFIMAADQFQRPIVHTFSRLMDVLPVEREGSGTLLRTIRRSVEFLQSGRAVGIFPEGRRSRTGRLLPPERGLGLISKQARVPVIPVAIVGTREAMPPGVRFPRPHRVTVIVGEPVDFPTPCPTKEKPRLTMEAIAEMMRKTGHWDYVYSKKPDSGDGDYE